MPTTLVTINATRKIIKTWTTAESIVFIKFLPNFEAVILAKIIVELEQLLVTVIENL